MVSDLAGGLAASRKIADTAATKYLIMTISLKEIRLRSGVAAWCLLFI